MRISNQTIYQSINFRLSKLTEELKTIQEQIATGKRINKPSDDPISTTEALRLRKALSQVEQYGENIKHGSSWLGVTNVALGAVRQFISQAIDVVSQMSVGTGTAGEKQSATQEIQSVLEQLKEIGNTQLNGRYIFSGYQDRTPAFTNDLTIHPASADPGNNPAYTGTVTSSGTYTDLYSRSYIVEITTGGGVGTARYRVSEDGGATWGPDDAFVTSTSPVPVYQSEDLGARIAFSDSGTLTAGDRFSIDVSRYQGDSGKIEIVTGSSTRTEINLTGEEVFGEAGSDLFDILTRLKDALETNDLAGIQASLEPLVRFQNQMIGHQAEVGSRQERIELCKNILSDLNLNYTNQLSDTEGIDMTQAITLLQVKQTLYESALYSASQIMNLNFIKLLG
jgi:flagellar hook-associated protein 3 FlgL